MRPTRLNPKRVVSRARTQVQGFLDLPELEKGMSCPPVQVKSTLDKVFQCELAQEQLKKALKGATMALQQALTELQGQVGANIGVAGMLYGAGSAQLIRLGGNPRRNGRRVVAGPTPPTVS